MTTHPAETRPPRIRRRTWIISIVLALAVAVAFGAGFALRSQQDAAPTRNSMAQLASVQSGCDDWAATDNASGPSDTWCSGMVDWMSERMGPAMMDSDMMDSDLWADPDQLRMSCRQWADDNPDLSGTSAAPTCDDMVDWMDAHSAGRWGMWTMHDR